MLSGESFLGSAASRKSRVASQPLLLRPRHSLPDIRLGYVEQLHFFMHGAERPRIDRLQDDAPVLSLNGKILGARELRHDVFRQGQLIFACEFSERQSGSFVPYILTEGNEGVKAENAELRTPNSEHPIPK